MPTFPSPRMMAISAALFRRLRDGVAIAIVGFAAGVVFCPTFFVIMFLMDNALSLAGVKHAILLPSYIYPPLFACGIASAIAWTYFSRPSPSSAATGSAPSQSFLNRAMMRCARPPQILISALAQFLGDAPKSMRDPRTLSFFQLYANRRPSSGHGSIVAAIAVSLRAFPAFFIALGLVILGLSGAVLALLLGIPATIHQGAFTARDWASGVAERLAAEGAADLATNEASLLEKSVPTSPNKAAKAQRI